MKASVNNVPFTEGFLTIHCAQHLLRNPCEIQFPSLSSRPHSSQDPTLSHPSPCSVLVPDSLPPRSVPSSPRPLSPSPLSLAKRSSAHSSPSFQTCRPTPISLLQQTKIHPPSQSARTINNLFLSSSHRDDRERIHVKESHGNP